LKIKSFWATNLWGNDHCCCFKMIYNWSVARKRANANSVWCFKSCINNMYTWVKPSKIMYLNTSSRHLLNGLKWMKSDLQVDIVQPCTYGFKYNIIIISFHTQCVFLQTYYGGYSMLKFQEKEKNFKTVVRLIFANNI
jgi:hypothetical protein